MVEWGGWEGARRRCRRGRTWRWDNEVDKEVEVGKDILVGARAIGGLKSEVGDTAVGQFESEEGHTAVGHAFLDVG